MKLLEDGVEPLQSPPQASAFIIDAMALLQTLTRVPDRFGNAEQVSLASATVFHQARKILGESRSSCARCTMTLTVEVSMERDTSCSARARNNSHTSFPPPMPLYRNISGVPTIKLTSGNTDWRQESPTNNQKVRDGDLEERRWRTTGQAWHQHQNW